MPIYDNDGTANREIGKLYDHNGSANTQIGKVYDNNGSANSLIYSSELILIGNNRTYTSGWSAIGGPYAGYGSVTDNGTNVLQYSTPTSWGNAAGSGNARTAALIDLTGFSTLYFTTREFWYAQYGRVGLSRADKNGQSGLGNNDRIIDNGSVYKTDRYTAFTSAGTYSINVSDLNGNYYIYLGLIAVGNSSNGTAHVYYENMYCV